MDATSQALKRELPDGISQEAALGLLAERLGCDRATARARLALAVQTGRIEPSYRWQRGKPEPPLYSLAELERLVAKPRDKGGRPATAIPLEIQARLAAWLAAEGCPEKQVDVEKRLHELLAADGREAAESTVRDYASTLFNAYRQALREGR